ncbi:hypothetical protein D3C76_1578010 [compost metagenome]
MGCITADGRVFRQGAFATRQRQQTPRQLGPTFPLAGHGAFALAVGERVRHLLYTLGVGAFDFIQRQHGVIAA